MWERLGSDVCVSVCVCVYTGGCAMLSFEELCGKPVAAADYLAIAEVCTHTHTHTCPYTCTYTRTPTVLEEEGQRYA